MIVRLCRGELCLLIVAHAPALSYAAATSFWTQLSNDIPFANRSWPLIAFVDASARIGSIVSLSVGAHRAEEENLAGECFHTWLHARSLFLPQTDGAAHR